jgi:glycosyltransferase involved in cell wall biosynthesis
VNQQPLVSVIIPAYNNAEYLGDAIKSVLRQTYGSFELIIVNDASPDNTDNVIKSFTDPRIRYFQHEINKGLSAARNTGIRESQGDFVALLDGDDYFHVDKLYAHVNFLVRHPDIDVTYNARFELNHSSTTVRELWRPPKEVGLADFILGYPFSPSDMVLRRNCLFQVSLFDESYTYYGEDMDINCKLALAGYKFASVDKALNYRRFHSERTIKNLALYKEDEFRPLYKTFADDRFPKNLSVLKDISFSNRYLGWAIFAFLQEDTALGQEYFKEATRLNPSLLENGSHNIAQELIKFSILDDRRDHEKLLRNLIRQLPDEFKPEVKQAEERLIARGYLLKGVRAIIWDRLEEGKEYFIRAAVRGAQMNTSLFSQISADLVSYEKEFGTAAAQKAFQDLTPLIDKIENPTTTHWSKGLHLINKAYMSFNKGEYAKALSWIVQAFMLEPAYLRNRGMIKVFLLSLTRRISDEVSN